MWWVIQTLTSLNFHSWNTKSWLTRQCACACEFSADVDWLTTAGGWSLSYFLRALKCLKKTHRKLRSINTPVQMFTRPHTSVKLSEHHLPHHFKLSSSRSPSQIFGKMCLSAEVLGRAGVHFSARWCVRSSLRCWFPGHLHTTLFDTFQSFRAPTYSTF